MDDSLEQKTGHLAWCALVALRLESQEKGTLSEYQENIFLIRWLTNALKQCCFSEEVVPDIKRLLKEGRERGELATKLECLWLSSTLVLSDSNCDSRP
ncbi:DUF2913 family protein [Salmonella enterica subsp. enterica serovar Typhimurium]|uniref:DUF2913 family protein n=1 Tax=Enterobacteriaceae TaxID=543 RepID=UPI0003311D3A|nr:MULTISPECIES: DUF2913 family protein [Enterobacteriaceae]EBD1155407.1 DUF2913 family protein [Salmonella enterica subsp. enterica serovar Uganda]EBI0198269.1 DUF2913 family protein [Salmonella enterica subsp. enterica serovar Liverpool]ECU6887982.1 DUF2913 family protein [Salmonella enterica subsp. enterica serovar Muenster]EDW7034227.1 DUF2913 family protein [Salmonella enterica subsp. enterica serovar 4,[5],12:i:-]EEJ2831181.1 DUF2913 family protein [Salmonella enterica subsp. enterica se